MGLKSILCGGMNWIQSGSGQGPATGLLNIVINLGVP